MLSRIRERLLCAPQEAPGDADAAVLIAITAEREPQVILTVRASHMRSHPGEVAFPGGRRDAADRSLIETALRESREEIGLDPGCVEILAAGRQRTSRFGVRVYPFVGVVPADVRLSANPAELEEVFRVPLAYFLRRENLRVQRIVDAGRELDVAWYPWRERQVWGMTAVMLIDLLNTAFDFGVELRR
ncbi:MAG: CoA pyrophosphatase [Gammaproteobacteria bacterium]|nr:CoA pyrophosphatase [Gammaproteobacteria bacterium]